jgi:hypothetical protein
MPGNQGWIGSPYFGGIFFKGPPKKKRSKRAIGGSKTVVLTKKLKKGNK